MASVVGRREPGAVSGTQMRPALEVVRDRCALVKTVGNGDWLRLLSNLAHKPLRTSLSLLPPDGRMHLFGKSTRQVAGLLFDRRQCDLTTAYCWPSGYFAKTEHHLHVDASTGNVHLTGGRGNHLTTLDALLNALSGVNGTAEPPQYNELSIVMRGVVGLCGIIVRSSAPEDVLFAMGVQALLSHLFPGHASMPLLRHSPTSGITAITHEEQLELLRPDATRVAPAPSTSVGVPRLPVDTLSYPELGPVERLNLHALHGIEHRALHETFRQLATVDGGARLASHVVHSLCAAALVDNVASAREIVLASAPVLLAPLLEVDGRSVCTVRWASCSGDWPGDEDEQCSNAACERTATDGQAAKGELAFVRSIVHSVTPLRRVCSDVGCSGGMLVALGAHITISEFIAGRTAERLGKACRWLEDWCHRAEPGPCSPAALIFLVTSWLEARKVDGNSDWLSFLSGKAVRNRMAFHSLLTDLHATLESGNGLEWLAKLYQLTSRLHKPCLRLRILQQVLGLDTRYSRDIVHGVICLAFDALEDISNRQNTGGGRRSEMSDGRAPPVGGPTQSQLEKQPLLKVSDDSEEEGSALDLDGYDEATRLDADALLGSPRRGRRPSDPLGEESRRARVLYHYR